MTEDQATRSTTNPSNGASDFNRIAPLIARYALVIVYCGSPA
jgi:hypothetical protein